MYYVVGEGGAKYGPADLDTLKGWVAENRLTPTMTLEDAATGAQFPAGQAPGLFPTAPVQPIQQTPVSPVDAGAAPTAQPSSPYQSPQQAYQDPAQTQNPYSSSGPYSQNPYQTPAAYNRSSGAANNNSIVPGWVCFGLSLACCCLPAGAIGIYFGNKAKTEGHDQGNLVMILNIITTVLAAGYWIFQIVVFLGVMATSASP